MLTIRDQQIFALGRMREDQFAEKMVRYVESEFPGEYERVGESGVRKWVSDILQLASEHKVETEGAIAVMVQLSMMFGARLERSPDAEWANEYLAKVTVPDTIRLQKIRERLTEPTQGRAIRRFEPGAAAK